MADRKSFLMGAVAGVALAIIMVFAIPGAALVSTHTTADSIGPHGYVTVSVTRDGQEIYYHADHNVITNAGKDFIAAQIGSDDPAENGANWIGLSSNTDGTDASHTSLEGEIEEGGLERAQGTFNLGSGSFTITNTFTAGAEYLNVQLAGLFTAEEGGTMMAENTFTPVSLSSGDQLTITWTITLT